MNRKTLLLIVAAALLVWSDSRASITSVVADYSGGIYCYGPILTTDSGTGGQSVALNGSQWSPGAMDLTIATDTAEDPTLTINNSINNTSSFDWTEYVVSIAMDQSFTISSAGVIAPSGWAASVIEPVGPVNGVYTGTIDYTGGTPVAIYPALNSTLDFGYQVTFSGSTQYSLTQSANPVPEPGVLSLLAVAGLLLCGWKFSKSASLIV